MSRPRVRHCCLVALLALVAAGVAAASARADAPDVKVSTPPPGQHPFETGTATVDSATGHVTVTLKGGWSWPTHGKDCNTDRAGAGVAVNWFDPQDRGFHLAFFDAGGGPVDKTPGGPDDFGVGATGADGLNPTDDVVHPTENDTGTGAVVDITDPGGFASWRGGCGVFSSDTVLVNNKGSLSYTTATVSHGNFGRATPSSTDTSGTPFDNPTPPSSPARQGALLEHVYASKSDVTQVCAVMYDVHPGTTASADNGVGIPGSAKEVTAGQQAVAAGAHYSGQNNGDNSIEGNGNTPTGNSCPTFNFSTSPEVEIVKTADAAQVDAGRPIGFTLTVFNPGTGAAQGVKLSDPLPANSGLSWSIDAQGAGWGGTCSISAGVLSCGGASGVTVPAGTTQAASTFTVHITSPTTAATGGGCPGGSGVVDNTGEVTTSNAGSGQSSASTCVAGPAVEIVKTPDQAQVTVGEPIGFTLTVSNDGTGDARDVTLTDVLPTNAGLSWSIAAQGAGWAGSCGIAGGVLTCGPVTVPHGTSQASSTFTVHITSPTTAATGGDCPGSGMVDNTGEVTTSNAGSDQSSASTCVQALVDVAVSKTGSPATQELGQGNITWTIVVTNNGPDTDTNVTVSDPMPAGNTYVSSSTTQGTCTGGAILTCDIGTMAMGAQVTITLVTTPSATGTQTNTVTVSGSRPETNTANNTATATVEITGKLKPPVFCVAVSKVTPKQLFVGRRTTLTIHLTKHGKAVKGVRVKIKGPKLSVRTKPSNAKGVVKQVVKMRKAGVLVFSPIASKRCNTKRVGVTGVFTPPVTG